MANRTQVRVTAAQKRKQALDLRIAGATYRQIAEKVGWRSPASAKEAVEKELAAIPRDSAKELLQLQLDRIDVGILAIFKDYKGGDQFAIDRMVKLMDHQAKLVGLYQREAEDNTDDVKQALLDFGAGLKDLFRGDDYGNEHAGDEPGPSDGGAGA